MKMHCSLNKVIARAGATLAQDHPVPAFPCNSPEAPLRLRSNISIVVSCLFAAVVAAGCASTKVTDQQQLVTGLLPKPNHILVHNFVATPSEVPADSVLAGEPNLDKTPQTPEQIAEGRKLGAQITAELVQQIVTMGMPAELATAGVQPQLNDLVIRGYLLSIKEGSAAERVAIGFGAGKSELRTLVEGFEMTAQGLRKLGSGAVDAGGNKTPGAALGVATFLATANPAGLIVSGGAKAYGEASGKDTIEGRAKATAKEIADVLKKRFQEQGWINQ
jgi:hypothetical protein